MSGRLNGNPVSAVNATAVMEHIWHRSLFLLTLASGTLLLIRSTHRIIYVPSPKFMMKPSGGTVAFRVVPNPKLVM
ncbi:hypothetical protein ACHAXS_005935 [Conticribra weissflogii]